MIDFRDVRSLTALKHFVAAFEDLPKVKQDIILVDMNQFLDRGEDSRLLSRHVPDRKPRSRRSRRPRS